MAPGRPPELGAAARLGAVALGCLTVVLLALVPRGAPGRPLARVTAAAANDLLVLEGDAAGSQEPKAEVPADGGGGAVADGASAAQAAWEAGASSAGTASSAIGAASDGGGAGLGASAASSGQAVADAPAEQQSEAMPAATMVGLHFDPTAITTPAAVRPGEFVTDEMGRKSFAWTPATRTVLEAMQAAFPGGQGWTPTHFEEGSGVTWTLPVLAKWIEEELLGGPDPFAAHGGQVPVPWNTEEDTGDQLGPRRWVGYSRRQVCFIVAKSLVGAGTAGYRNGLLRFLEKPTNDGKMPRAGGFGRAWWGLLAACAADPGLQGGSQGPQLVVAKADAPTEVAELRGLAKLVQASAAGLRVCSYADGSDGALLDGLQPVPPAGCQQPTEGQVGKDFMAGGLHGQATQDISAAWLGGYVFGNADGLGGGQDERLMVYFPEVSALTFFLSQSGQTNPEAPQLRQPVWILGARRLFTGIDGTCRHNSPLVLDAKTPLAGDLVTVTLGDNRYRMSSSRPFLAFMSQNQGFITGSAQAQAVAVRLARRNKEPRQRDVSPASEWSFEKQVQAWHRAVALTSYSESVQPALRALVTSVGTGPWLAGLWFGDSQLGFLASWMGQALAAGTWGQSLPLDYYVYASFTENPGNQCFVHSKTACQACLASCAQQPLPKQSYWLPGSAFFDAKHANACVPDKGDCGTLGLPDIVKAYRSRSVSSLWTDLEATLWQHQGDTSSTVFDLLLQASPTGGAA